MSNKEYKLTIRHPILSIRAIDWDDVLAYLALYVILGVPIIIAYTYDYFHKKLAYHKCMKRQYKIEKQYAARELLKLMEAK